MVMSLILAKCALQFEEVDCTSTGKEVTYSIDPIHVDDPLFPINNVGRNCFRIHQCIKTFSEAYSTLEHKLSCASRNGETYAKLRTNCFLTSAKPLIQCEIVL